MPSAPYSAIASIHRPPRMDVGAITLPPCFMNNIKPNSIYFIKGELIREHFKRLRLKVKIETMACLIGQGLAKRNQLLSEMDLSLTFSL